MRPFYLEGLHPIYRPCMLCDAQQHTRYVIPSLTNTMEQRGKGGLTNITITSQVACDLRKVFRAELVSTPPDELDTLSRSSKVRKR